MPAQRDQSHQAHKVNSMMKHATVSRPWFLAVVAVIAFPSFLLAQQKTLTRQYDPIISAVGKLLPLSGDTISVNTPYCYINGEFKPSPFQIDELTGRGELENKDNVADDNDEVVFMPNSTGDRAPTDKWIEGSANTRIELEVTDPLNNQKGWLYLFRYVPNPPTVPSHLRYARGPATAGSDTVSGISYVEAHNNVGWFTDTRIKPPFGNGQDILDVQKVRVSGTFVIFGIPVPLTLKEDILQFVGVQFESGPVRGFRELSLKISVAGNDLEASFTTQFLPYSTLFGAKNATIPVVSGLTVTEIRQSVDFNTNAAGMTFFNAFNRGGFPVDGTPDQVNRSILDRTNTNPPDSLNWYMVRGNPGVFLVQMIVPVLGTTREFYYSDNSATNNDDTGDKRSYGDSGLRVTSTSNITGSLSFNFTTYYLGNDSPADIGDQLKTQTQNPVQVTATRQTRTFTAVQDERTTPTHFVLGEAAPNPFAPKDGAVLIGFTLGRTNAPPRLRILNLLGQEVFRFESADLLRSQAALWNGRDRSGRLVPAGIYFYELSAGRQRAVKKLVVLR